MSREPYPRKVRLILWGGSPESGDNSAFQWAARKVGRDYENNDSGKIRIELNVNDNGNIRTARNIVDRINSQADGSILSLDILTHAGPEGVRLSTAPKGTGGHEWSRFMRYMNDYNASLYRSKNVEKWWIRFRADY